MTNTILLTGTDYFRLADRSSYNHNFYQHRETGEVLLEICSELYNSFEIYREENGELNFLGDSDDSLESVHVTIYPYPN
jgi:hypothetical protein